MIRLIHKKASVGWTGRLAEMLSLDYAHYLAHFVLYFEQPCGVDIPPLCLAQLALVQCPIVLSGQPDERVYGWQPGDRADNALDRNALILPFRVWKEEDFIRRDLAGREVDQGSVFSLPDGMKLCFEPYALEFQDGPAKFLFAAMGGNMLWNNRKTFFEWFVGQRLVADVNRLGAADEVPAE